MWKTRLRRWGVYKNFSKKQLEALDHEQERRSAAGKQSVTKRGGLPVDEIKLARSFKRMKILCRSSLHQGATDKNAMRDIECRTPSPTLGLITIADATRMSLISHVTKFISGTLLEPNAVYRHLWAVNSGRPTNLISSDLTSGCFHRQNGDYALCGAIWRGAMRNVECVVRSWGNWSLFDLLRCFTQLHRHGYIELADFLRHHFADLARACLPPGDPRTCILDAFLQTDLPSMLQAIETIQDFVFASLEHVEGDVSKTLLVQRCNTISWRLLYDKSLSIEESYPRLNDIDEKFGRDSKTALGLLLCQAVSWGARRCYNDAEVACTRVLSRAQHSRIHEFQMYWQRTAYLIRGKQMIAQGEHKYKYAYHDLACAWRCAQEVKTLPVVWRPSRVELRLLLDDLLWVSECLGWEAEAEEWKRREVALNEELLAEDRAANPEFYETV